MSTSAALGLLAGVVTLAFASGPLGSHDAEAASAKTRFSLANGCFALRPRSPASFVAKSGDGYRASAGSAGAAEPIFMKATALGKYMLYGKQGDYVAGTAQNGVESAAQVGPLANWKIEEAGSGSFRLILGAAGNRVLSASGPGGALTLAARGAAGNAGLFTFTKTGGCASFPEVEISAQGLPRKGTTSYTETRGLVDAHIHWMAFEFLGGRAHCGRPWHEFGVEKALVDCDDHYPANGGAAVLENVLFGGSPARMHDPVGWPTFKDWPHHESLTHEQTYYKWVERAWMGGLRVYVNLLVDNAVLCEIYPYKQNSCNEMDSVRLQARRIRELEDYVDAQSGGPGKGFFRIVTNPFQAREVINDGKLAVILGIENSKLFDCGLSNDRPECDRKQIDRQLDEVYKLGVRDMELVNKFDNALAGVAGDSGSTGAAVNGANKVETGKFWHMETCSDGHAHVHDKNQLTADGEDRDALVGNGFNAFAPAGTLPVYPAAPHCNTRGLSDLGEYTIRQMVKRKMIVDPDHMSVIARKQTLAVLEAEKYSGVVSSHTWSTPDAIPRIFKLGGFVTPYAGSSTSFVDQWKEFKPMRSKKHYFGFGYGADMNGFGSQGGPRTGAKNPVTYPFKSFDGSVTFSRQKSGQRLFDINKDGVAHYGLYPDWLKDLEQIAGKQIIADMARGSEAYLHMWERAVGVRNQACRSRRGRFSRRGLGLARLGLGPEAFLRRAGQPAARKGRVYRYCVDRRPKRKVVAVFTRGGKVGLVATTAIGHTTAGHVGAGDRSGRLRGKTKSFGKAYRIRRAGSRRIVYRVRKGRIRYVVVATKTVAKSPKRLRAFLRLAGLR